MTDIKLSNWRLELPPYPISVELINLNELAKIESGKQEDISLLTVSDLHTRNRPLGFHELITRVLGLEINLTHLDWLMLLRQHCRWGDLPNDKSASVRVAILHASRDLQWLKDRILWDAVLDWGNPERHKSLAFPLREALEKMPSSEFQERWGFAGEVANLYLAQDWRQLSRLCLSTLNPPAELLKSIRLPSNLSANQDVLSMCPHAYIQITAVEDLHAVWIVDCLKSMTLMQEKDAVNLLLEEASNEALRLEQLTNWLTHRYGPHAKDSRWSQLTSRAKLRLQSMVGLATYKDFCKIVDKVLTSIPADSNSSKQLQARRAFWSNYSDRFERLIVFLPQASARLIGIDGQSIDIRIMPGEDCLDSTDICLFDFGNYFVAEFFRGPVSETRLFDRSHNRWIENLFTTIDQPALQCFRCYNDSEAHDHRYLWQISCERWLHSHGIKPNDGLTRFANRDGTYLYSLERGLPPVSSAKLQNRQNQIEEWKIQLSRLEHLAGLNCCGRFNIRES